MLEKSKFLRIHTARTLQVIALTVGALLCCGPLFSQTNLGRISGGVTDQTGGAIVGATVTITDVDRGTSRTLTTDSAGEYNAPSLIPGKYTVRGEFAGFQAENRQNVQVSVGGDVRVDLQLQPGAQNQTITVSEAIPSVNTTNATLNSTLETKEVEDLPVEGNNYVFLYSLRPGIEARPGGGAQQNSSNGIRTESNDWMLDGLFDTKVDTGGFMLSSTHGVDGDQANILPVDAIQEINFIENPKAEYGWRAGAVSNVGLKSGTNSIHGTAHFEGRDTSLVDRNAFIPPTEGTGTNQFMQSGVTVGGPIKKDKLFFFGAFEWQRSYVQIPKILVVPTTQAGSGATTSFPDAIAALNAAHVAVNPLSAALAGCTSGLTSTVAANVLCSSANQGEVNGDPSTALFGNDQTLAQGGGNVLTDLPLQHQTFNELIKLDYHLNEHNSLNGEFFSGGGLAESGTNTRNFWRSYGFGGARIVRAVWTYTPNATLVNDMRFGYDFQSVPDGTGDCPGTPFTPPNYSALGLNTGVPQILPGTSTQYDLGSFIGNGTGTWSTCGFPNVNITGLAALGDSTGIRNSDGYFQGVDSVSYTHGKHVFKVGVEMRHQLMDSTGFGNQHGTVAFGNVAAFSGATPLEDFLAGTVSSSGSSIEVGSPVQTLENMNYGVFFEDDWRLTAKITLNLGVRWEYQEPWYEANGKYANFDPGSCPITGTNTNCSGLSQQTNNAKVVNGDYKDVMPRLGIAWDITGKGTTVVRAGGGIYYMGPSGRAIGTLGDDPTGGNFFLPTGASFTGTGSVTTATINLPPSVIHWAQYNGTPATQTFGTIASGVPSCGNGIGTNPAPCAISAMAPNITLGYASEWNLSFQHAFTNSLSLNVAYVGTHGTKLWGIDNINQPSVGIVAPAAGTLCAGLSQASCEQISRPFYYQPGQVTETPGGPVPTAAAPGGVPQTRFPWMAKINLISNLYDSNYNALQTSLTQRFSHGITLNGSWTWGHALGDGSTDEYYPQNSSQPGLEYGNDLNDIRQRITITASYAIPGRHGFGQMLEGWQLNTAIIFDSALPIEAQDITSDIAGVGDTGGGSSSTGAPGLRWDLFGNPSDFKLGTGNSSQVGQAAIPCFGVTGSTFAKAPCTTVATVSQMPAACLNNATNNVPANPLDPTVATGLASLMKYGCYAEGSSAILPPAAGTFGTMTLDELRAKGFRNWDITLTHTWVFHERYNAQFIAAVYNVANRTQYAGYGTNPATPSTFGNASETPDVLQNSTVLGQGGPRRINLGVKFIW